MERQRLLISDVDGTLLGDDEALAAFADWYETARERVRLVYASGRFYDSVVESIRTSDLPAPDAIIGGVGTEIRDYPAGRVIGDWPGDVDGWSRLNVCAALADVAGLRMQSPEFLSDYKISYHVHGASEEQLAGIAERLHSAGCRVELIYSSDRDLDVLPEGVDKGTAAEHLAGLWEFAPEDVLVCGDSGNDLPLFHRGFRGVIVGNAREELRSLRSPSVYHARRRHAAGVLEGVSHWLSASASGVPRGATSGRRIRV